ncbi:MATE family efflux transporter [Anaeromyxobacter sp. Fw109-5]|uniref:MATE family efflux transporter n=1 Tax=Anaeromyxobacter sp. (strain Fw109-5) TaxID=404589 RepID=UPI0000ED7790|nr:MATE family efflux transporter [Anaeromyxobacter sp. Fw109-5]ABS24470.1 MATE efflux family protein [Anaeromyxobacter sp. Fw109-5]
MDAPHPSERTRASGRSAILRPLLALAWPMVVSRATQVVVGIADAVMVAHLGEAALAATTTGATNAFSIVILPMGIVFVVQSFASQLFGRGDLAGARRFGWYGLAVAAGAQVLGVLGTLATPRALEAFAYAPDVRALMSGYLQIRLLSAGAVVGLEALSNYYGGLGDTRLPMRANLAAMVLNVAGNWLLIDGRLGLPALGVTGAAVASTLSTALAFAGLLAVFVREGRRTGTGTLRARELGRLLRFGVPSGVNWFFEVLAFVFFVNVVFVELGTTSLAALMAILQVNTVAFMPAWALASAGAILVGQAIGASHADRVPRLVAVTFAVSAAWQLFVGALYVLAPEAILAPFATGAGPGSAFVAIGRRVLLLAAAWQLFDAAAMSLGEALRAAGDTAFVMWMRVTLGWAVFVPGTWISVRELGAGEVVAVGWLVLWLALLALALLLRFRSGAWRRIELVPEAP